IGGVHGAPGAISLMPSPRNAEPVLYVVSDCPVCPGFGSVVILMNPETRRLVYYSPCCGIAFRDVPVMGAIEYELSLSQVDPGPVVLPSLDDIRKGRQQHLVVRTEAVSQWLDDIPLGRYSKY